MTDVPNGGSSPSPNMVQEKKKVAANIAMAFMQHQQLTQQLATQMTQMMQALVQQNQAIMQMLQMPRQSRIIRDPQTGDVVGSEQIPMQPPDQAPEMSGNIYEI
jgi:hypothetical protein